LIDDGGSKDKSEHDRTHSNVILARDVLIVRGMPNETTIVPAGTVGTIIVVYEGIAGCYTVDFGPPIDDFVTVTEDDLVPLVTRVLRNSGSNAATPHATAD